MKFATSPSPVAIFSQRQPNLTSMLMLSHHRPRVQIRLRLRARQFLLERFINRRRRGDRSLHCHGAAMASRDRRRSIRRVKRRRFLICAERSLRSSAVPRSSDDVVVAGGESRGSLSRGKETRQPAGDFRAWTADVLLLLLLLFRLDDGWVRH